MKIVVTGTRGIPNIQGGVETHCEELYPRIADKDHTVIIVRRPQYKSEHNSINYYKGVEIKDICTYGAKHFEAFIHTFAAVLYAKKVGADIVHIHAIGPSLMTPLVKLLGMSAVITHHGPDYDRKKWGRFSKKLLRVGEQLGANYADHVIVISNHIKSLVLNKYKSIKAISLIYNGVKLSASSDQDLLKELHLTPKRYLLAVGRFVEEKGFDLLIEAFNNAKLEGLQLVIAGDADHETPYSLQLKAFAQKHHIVLTGFIQKEQLMQLYANTELFVLPSYHEGLPISLLEAMNCNCNVLVSNIPANLEVGLPQTDYFQCGDCTDLMRQLKRKISHKEKPLYDMRKYDWDNIANQTKAIYDSLIK